MRYFFSTPSGDLRLLTALKAQNFLLSFAVDAAHLGKFTTLGEKIIVDSGAFSVWNKGGTIDINDYIAFIKKCPQDLTFINLDVIPKTGSTQKEIDICCEQGYENFLTLKKHSDNIMPVYHYGDDIKWLKRFSQLSDYIGISPANDTHENIKRKFLCKVFDTIDAHKIRTHGLGYSSFSGLALFPFYSVDSISYKKVAFYIDGKKKVFWRNQALDFFSRNRIQQFLTYEKTLTDLWKQRGYDWK